MKTNYKLILKEMDTKDLEYLYSEAGALLGEREASRRAGVEKKADTWPGIYGLLREDFQSSCYETAQFKIFYDKFTSLLKKTLKDKIKRIDFTRGHFYLSGFFETLTGKIYYFNLGDVRSDKVDRILIRTAKDFKDYSGGDNWWISISNMDQDILTYLN